MHHKCPVSSSDRPIKSKAIQAPVPSSLVLMAASLLGVTFLLTRLRLEFSFGRVAARSVWPRFKILQVCRQKDQARILQEGMPEY